MITSQLSACSHPSFPMIPSYNCQSGPLQGHHPSCRPAQGLQCLLINFRIKFKFIAMVYKTCYKQGSAKGHQPAHLTLLLPSVHAHLKRNRYSRALLTCLVLFQALETGEWGDKQTYLHLRTGGSVCWEGSSRRQGPRGMGEGSSGKKGALGHRPPGYSREP